MLLGLQDAPLDMSNFYAADNGCWSLFNVFGVPKKTYYAFKAFKALVDHPKRVLVEGGKPGELNAVAGLSADGRELAIVVSNFKSADRQIELVLQNLPWTGPSTSELLVLDQSRNLERIRKEEHRDRSHQNRPGAACGLGSCWSMCEHSQFGTLAGMELGILSSVLFVLFVTRAHRCHRAAGLAGRTARSNPAAQAAGGFHALPICIQCPCGRCRHHPARPSF